MASIYHEIWEEIRTFEVFKNAHLVAWISSHSNQNAKTIKYCLVGQTSQILFSLVFSQQMQLLFNVKEVIFTSQLVTRMKTCLQFLIPYPKAFRKSWGNIYALECDYNKLYQVHGHQILVCQWTKCSLHS